MPVRPTILLLSGLMFVTGCSPDQKSTTGTSTPPAASKTPSPAAAKKTPEWQTVQDPSGRYSVEVPGQPSRVSEFGFYVSVSGNSTVAVNVSPASLLALSDEQAWKSFQANPADADAAEKLLRAHADQALASLKNPRASQDKPETYTIASSQRVQVGDFTGLDVVMKLEGGNRVYTRRFVLTPQDLVEALVNAPEGEIAPETIQQVISSLKVNTPSTPPAAAK
jgi:hypothetical protein